MRSPAILLAVVFPAILQADHAATQRAAAVEIVRQIQRADYEGDRAALHRLHESMSAFRADTQLASAVGYWSGFALWRRALNGFNESVDPRDLEQDLHSALTDFATVREPATLVLEANVAASACLYSLIYLNPNDAERLHVTRNKLSSIIREAKTAEPDNPRLLWVLGASQWYTPTERGGGEAIALATYRKALDAIHERPSPADELLPTWGRPELLMNLAWSNLHRSQPNLEDAERYARQALALVPYWHYMRDILLPQIVDAKTGKLHA